MRKRFNSGGRVAHVCMLLVVLGFFPSCEKPASQSQRVTQETAGGAGGSPTEVTTSSGIQMAYLPGGEFLMGSDKGNPDEAPMHKVKLSPFLIDRFEVTHEMFAKVQLPNPSRRKKSGSFA